MAGNLAAKTVQSKRGRASYASSNPELK